MSDLLKACPVIIPIPVAWGEMDAFSHVNNVIYFKYFESVRIAYFEKLDMMNLMEETGIGPILASTQCRYKVPLTYPDTVSVGTRVSTIGDDRFTMEYIVVSQTRNLTAAEGEALIVAYDYRKNAKARLPEVLTERIRLLEKKSD
ncbi:thioesterase family protein [Desulfatiferula olefinivorans]